MPPFFVKDQRAILFFIDNVLIGGANIPSKQWEVDSLFFGDEKKFATSTPPGVQGVLYTFSKILFFTCLILFSVFFMGSFVSVEGTVLQSVLMSALYFGIPGVIALLWNRRIAEAHKKTSSSLQEANRRWIEDAIKQASLKPAN